MLNTRPAPAAAGRAAAAAVDSVDSVGEPMVELTRANGDRDPWGQDLGDPRVLSASRSTSSGGWRAKTGVAGRLVVRQTGAVRARVELFPGGDVPEDREIITEDLAADDGAPRPNGG